MAEEAQPTGAPLEELLPTPELLSYYKARVADFEKEREELVNRVAKCGVDQADLHTLEWENKKRADEIWDLQKDLSDAHTYLFEERERLLQLQSENDSLRLQEVEDRKKIQHLLSLTQPGEQEITYVRDGRPDAVTVYPRGREPLACKRNKGATGVGPERVLRTVYLPTANADSLLLKVESLQAQLNEQRQFASERVAALLEDRKIREQDEASHRMNFQQQTDQQSQKIQKLEEILRTTTRDYILARKEKQMAEARAATHEARTIQETRQLSEELKMVQKGSKEELATVQQAAQETVEDYVTKFREQVRVCEDEISGLETVHASMKGQYEQRASDLETKVQKLTEKNKQIEYRRALDLEGFTSDISLLRKQLLVLDRKLHQMRLLDRLEGDERLDAILKSLEKRAPSVKKKGQKELGDGTLSEVASELGRIKGSIIGIEDRLHARRSYGTRKK
ncbi:hypothetical protein BSKO_01809 [Bryopsis sp. KO-2023]|nr:hypothetical protein BSKO_01809 [Bryopsis sp. KO-2023]